jgi:hypothetical protein
MLHDRGLASRKADQAHPPRGGAGPADDDQFIRRAQRAWTSAEYRQQRARSGISYRLDR